MGRQPLSGRGPKFTQEDLDGPDCDLYDTHIARIFFFLGIRRLIFHQCKAIPFFVGLYIENGNTCRNYIADLFFDDLAFMIQPRKLLLFVFWGPTRIYIRTIQRQIKKKSSDISY